MYCLGSRVPDTEGSSQAYLGNVSVIFDLERAAHWHGGGVGAGRAVEEETVREGNEAVHAVGVCEADAGQHPAVA